MAESTNDNLKTTQGFTLVELIVAAALTTLLTAFLLIFSGRVLRDWNRISSKLGAYTELRMVRDTLKLDLQSAVFRADGREWLRSVPLSENSGRGGRGDWLMFYANVPDHTSEMTKGNALCAISYRLAQQNPTNGNTARPIYGLYRAVADPQETFAVALDPATPSLEAFWGSNKGTTRDPLNFRGLLAANVVDFRIIYHYPDGTTSEPGAALAIGPTSPQPVAIPMPQHPHSVEAIFTVLSDEGMKQLKALSAQQAVAAMDRLIQRYGHTISQRIKFPPVVL